MNDIDTVQSHPGNGLDYQRHSIPSEQIEQPPVLERQEQFDRHPHSQLDKAQRLRADIKKAIEQRQLKPSEDVEAQAPTQGDEAPEVAAEEAVEATHEGEPVEQAAPKSPTDEAPVSWTKKAKAEWSKLPDAIKSEVWKREQDVEKGIQSLKSQYQTIDQIKAKYEPALKRVNIQFNDLIDGAGGWFVALSGPERVKAAAHLLKQFGIDPATLAGPIQHDPLGVQGQLSPQLAQYIQNMAADLDQYKQHTAAQVQTAAANFVENWAKDKPYFKAVRGEMGRLLGSGEIPLLPNGQPDMDTAYNKAIEPILEQMQQTEAKRLEEQRQQRAKKQAAAASLSSRKSPGGADVRVNGAARPGLSVRDSLKQAIRELS